MIVLSDVLISAIRSGQARKTQLVTLTFKSGLVKNYCDIAGQITVDEVLYFEAGHPFSVEGLSDTDRLQVHEIVLSFPVDAVTEYLLTEEIVNADIVIKSVWIDTLTGLAIDSPLVEMRCLGDKRDLDYSENGLKRLDLVCRTPFQDMSRPPLAFYTDNEQKSIHPGDTGFSFISGLVNLEQAGWTLSATGTNTVYLELVGGVVQDTAGRAVVDQNGAAVVYNNSVILIGARAWGLSTDFLGEKYYLEYNGNRVPAYEPPFFGKDTVQPVVLKDGFFQIEISPGVFTKLIVGADGVIFTEENLSIGMISSSNIQAAFFQNESFSKVAVHDVSQPTYQYYIQRVSRIGDNTDYIYYGKVSLV